MEIVLLTLSYRAADTFRYLILAIATVLMVVGPAQAGTPKILKTKIDLYERFGAPVASGPAGVVVIDTITIDRSPPVNFGDSITVHPNYLSTQIGWYEKNGQEYLIVLDGTDIKQLVRDAITLGLNRAGYAVVAAGDPDAAAAAHMDVEVVTLWTWVETVQSNRTSRQNVFFFDMETIVRSKTPALANIATVKGFGYRNGSRTTNWKSYRNTALHAIKFFIDDFERMARASIEFDNSKQLTLLDGKMPVLVQVLVDLSRLRGAGTISEGEYQEFRKDAIESIADHNSQQILRSDTKVSTLVRALEDLTALRDAGTISEDEFQKLRKRAIEDGTE